MTVLRDLPLVDSRIAADATFADAVEALLQTRAPALAVLDDNGSLVGTFTEDDVLRAMFPSYLGDLRHTAFLPDDADILAAQAQRVRERPVAEFARPVEELDADDSQTHAAERFMHTGEDALPVTEGGRFLGILSVAALCLARLAEGHEE